ncbi:hypothetical protein FLM48_02990 [Shewanella sp. Scap07]|uniref:hypothetical protein n=1 Tax=Shewanella sp. Scap07 TaxID=2589987 RepID=UPI0015BF59DA|nr:hypothetical protein [Shewanella sp. Scap07]QLE84141.1 hypothetical protein FLM48_02990 [Shewanella sp. Scap07]
MGWLKALWQGFLGGADFNYQVTERFILEDKLLTITLPASNIASVEPPKEINYPYRNRHWFSEQQRTHTHETYVHIYTELWMYLPIIPILPSCEYGMLSCVFRVKQTPDRVNALDNQALGDWLNREYDEHYNHPIEGENSQGRNTYLRKDMSKHTTLSDEVMAAQLEGSINNWGYPPIPDSSPVNIKGVEWVFHQLVKPYEHSRTDMYCLGLDENHFLVVRFNHRVDRSDKYKKWRKAANKTQQRVMEQVSLTDYTPQASTPQLTDGTLDKPFITTASAKVDTVVEQETA